VKIVDTHTHLSSEDFKDDREAAIQRALVPCEALIDIGSGTSEEAHRRSRQLAESHSAIYFTAGIHPHDAVSLGSQPKLKKEIASFLTHEKCVAVGEAGLDYYYEHSPREPQIEVFNWQIQLAKELALPLMIHTRDAEDDTMECLKDFEGHAVFHCFTGSQKLADFAISKGFFISFSGIVTFKKAEDLRQVFLSLPLENILIETDSPYLAPDPLRGKRNESAFIIHTAERLAALKSLKLQDFIDQSSGNAYRLFDKMKPCTSGTTQA